MNLKKWFAVVFPRVIAQNYGNFLLIIKLLILKAQKAKIIFIICARQRLSHKYINLFLKEKYFSILSVCLLKAAMESRDQIAKDLLRTLPNNIRFSDIKANGVSFSLAISYRIFLIFQNFYR